MSHSEESTPRQPDDSPTEWPFERQDGRAAHSQSLFAKVLIRAVVLAISCACWYFIFGPLLMRSMPSRTEPAATPSSDEVTRGSSEPN